ncbi:MAG TPA: peptidase [bacterium]|jgi:putative proteasome-type protease|nr:peptidase [bacterium]
MTFCLGIKLKGGLVGLSDTRITSGNEVFLAKKVATFQQHGYPMFLMTSGLRSVRDKVLTYFDDELAGGAGYDRLYKAASAFGAQVRKVAQEDGQALMESNLSFNIHALIGGRLSADSEPKLYLIYPQGNWVEINEARPYHIIGESGFGRPVLDRSLKHGDSIAWAFKVGCLAFDSTRISASDVDFPLDVVLYRDGDPEVRSGRLQREDLADLSKWWSERLRMAVSEIPQDWVDSLVDKVLKGPVRDS